MSSGNPGRACRANCSMAAANYCSDLPFSWPGFELWKGRPLRAGGLCNDISAPRQFLHVSLWLKLYGKYQQNTCAEWQGVVLLFQKLLGFCDQPRPWTGGRTLQHMYMSNFGSFTMMVLVPAFSPPACLVQASTATNCISNFWCMASRSLRVICNWVLNSSWRYWACHCYNTL